MARGELRAGRGRRLGCVLDERSLVLDTDALRSEPRVSAHDFGLGARTDTIRWSPTADGTSALRAAGTQAVEGRIEAIQQRLAETRVPEWQCEFVRES